jgi:hypothetical protein
MTLDDRIHTVPPQQHALKIQWRALSPTYDVMHDKCEMRVSNPMLDVLA